MLKQLRNHKTDAFIEKGLDSEGWCGLLKAFDNWRNLLSQFSVTTEAYVFDWSSYAFSAIRTSLDF